MLLENIKQQIPRWGSHAGKDYDVAEEDTADRIALYVDGRLSSEQSDEVQMLLQRDKRAMKSALHYALHAHASDNQVAPALQKSGGGAWSRFLGNCRQVWSGLQVWRAPVWISVPIAAVALVTLSFMFAPALLQQKSGPVFVTYQDDPVVYFRHAQQQIPGIGFFTAARDSQQSYQGVSVSGTASHLSIRWPAVDNAEKYTVSIYQTGADKRTLLGQMTTVTTEAEFAFNRDLPRLEKNRRYEWEIQGPAGKGMNFFTQGGFVLN